MKTAIVLGATGLTGGILLEGLLEDDRYSKVKIFSRKPIGMAHPKLEEHLLDLFELEKRQSDFTGDEVFVCIGTTKAKTPDPEMYRKVDYGIPVAAAKLAKQNGVDSILIISSMGSSPSSRILYNRLKGEMERDVLMENIPNTYFLQPSLITGDRKEKRAFEGIFKQVMKVGDKLLVGPLKKYRSIHPNVIARAMIAVANKGYPEVRIESDEIKEIAQKTGTL